MRRGLPALAAALALAAGAGPARAHSDAASFGAAGLHDHAVPPPAEAGLPRYAGRVVVDPRRVVNVTMRVNARITRILTGPPGSVVRQGAPLAQFTSAELNTLQQTYIETWKNRQRMAAASVTAPEKMLEARMNLQWRGLSEADVDRIEATRQPVDEVTLFAPIDGYLSQVNVAGGRIINAGTRQGLFTAAGTAVFQLADPSALLIEVAIPEPAARDLAPGDRLALVLADAGGAAGTDFGEGPGAGQSPVRALPGGGQGGAGVAAAGPVPAGPAPAGAVPAGASAAGGHDAAGLAASGDGDDTAPDAPASAAAEGHAHADAHADPHADAERLVPAAGSGARVEAVLPLVAPTAPWVRTVRLIPEPGLAARLRPGQLVQVLAPADPAADAGHGH